MSTIAYRILDEPRPGGLARFAVNPMWPLLSYMFGGAWFAWIWFLANGRAIGSATKTRELVVVLVGIVGIVALAIGMGLLYQAGIIPKGSALYALLVVTVWKLGITYWLFTLQSRSFELYQYFGQPVRNGLAIVVLALLVKPAVKSLSTNPLWLLVMT
jgi:hypothetical protein